MTMKAENIRRCAEQIRLGHSDAALRIMGFADGCIRDARRAVDGEMTKPGDVTHDV